jgi:hypothetical protein
MEALTKFWLPNNPQLTGLEAFWDHMQAHHPDCEVCLWGAHQLRGVS